MPVEQDLHPIPEGMSLPDPHAVPDGMFEPPSEIRKRVESLDHVPDGIPKIYGVVPSSVYVELEQKELELKNLQAVKPMGDKDPEVRAVMSDIDILKNFTIPSIEGEYEKRHNEWKESGKPADVFLGEEVAHKVEGMLPGHKYLPVRAMYDLILSMGNAGLDFYYKATMNRRRQDEIKESYDEFQLANNYQDQFSIMGEDWARRTRGVVRDLGTAVWIGGATGGAGTLAGAARGAGAAALRGGAVGSAARAGALGGLKTGQKLMFPALVTNEARSSYTDAYAEAVRSGMDKTKAHYYATSMGAIAGMITLAAGKLGANISAKTIPEMLRTGPSALKLKSVTKNVLGEMGEESLITFSQEVGRAVSKIDPHALDSENLWPALQETLIQTFMTAGTAEFARIVSGGHTADLKKQLIDAANAKVDKLAGKMRGKLKNQMASKYGKAGEDAVDDVLSGKVTKPVAEEGTLSRSELQESTGRKGKEYGSAYRENYANTLRELAKPEVIEEARAEYVREAEEELGEKGTKGPIDQDIELPEWNERPATKPGLMGLPTLQPFMLEDGVAVTRYLSDGQIPQITRMAAHILGVHKRDITASGDVFKGIMINRGITDERILAKTAFHEMGHLADWIDSGKMGKEGPLSRLAGIGGHTARRGFLNQLRKDGYITDEIKQELIQLSEWWSPYDKTKASDKYVKYRESSKELFAEFISTLLASPGDVQQRAPKSFKVFMNYLGNRPKVARSYIEMQRILNGSPEEIAAHRAREQERMFKRAEVRLKVNMAKQQQENESILETFINRGVEAVANKLEPLTARTFFDFFEPVRKYTKALARHWGKGAALELEVALDEWQRAGAASTLWSKEIGKLVAELEADGVTAMDLRQYLSATNILGQPDNKYANPRGETTRTAQQRLSDVEGRYTPEQYQKLQQKAAEIRQSFKDGPLRSLYEAELIDQETYESLLEQDYYSPRLIAKYIEHHVPSGIYQRIGTLEDALDPLTGTVLKGGSMLWAAEANKIKQIFNTVLTRFGETDEMRPLKRHEKPRPGKELFILKRHEERTVGKGQNKRVVRKSVTHRYEVPPEVHQMVAGPYAHPFAKMANSIVYDVFYPLYISFRTGFLIRNVPRDLQRTWWLGGSFIRKVRAEEQARLVEQGHTKEEAKELTKDMAIGYKKIIKSYLSALPSAYRLAKGNIDQRAQAALEARVLTDNTVTLEGGRFSNLSEQELYQQLEAAGFQPQDQSRVAKIGRVLKAIPLVGKFYTALAAIINTTEAASKIGAFELGQQVGLSPQQAAHLARTYAGTPNSRRRGDAAELLNALNMFTSVRLANLRSHKDLAFDKDAAPRYWKAASIPLAFQAFMDMAIAYGFFGDEMKEWWDLIPDYEKNSNWVLPIPMITTDSDGEVKAAYLKGAKDHDMAAATAAMRLAFEAYLEKDPAVLHELFDEVKDQVFGTWSPPIDIALTWSTYLGGGEPIDSFYDTPIMRESVLKQGGWRAHKEMLGWTVDQFGEAGDVLKTGKDLIGTAIDMLEPDAEADLTTLQDRAKAGPWRTMFGVSNRGIKDAQWRKRQEARLKRDKPGLMLRDGPAVSRLMSEYSHLNDLRLTGEQLSDKEKVRHKQLHRWNKVYERLRNSIKRNLELAEKHEGTPAAERYMERAERTKTQGHKLGKVYAKYTAAINSGDREEAARLQGVWQKILREE